MINNRTICLLVGLGLVGDWSISHAEPFTFDDISKRFRPYEPNYVIWQFTENDDDAAEARFSFKYITNRNLPEEDETDEARTEWYLKYTGEFDFYWGTRFSAPVINRVSNPGAHFRKYFAADKTLFGLSWDYLDIGAQHLSNGQTQDPTILRGGQTRAQTFFDQDPNHPYFDTISRSVNFLSIETNFRFGEKGRIGDTDGFCSRVFSCYDLWVRLIPYFFDDENPVTWGPDANRQSRVSDFDRLRIGLAKKIDLSKLVGDRTVSGFKELEIGGEWTIGDDLLDTDSLDIYLSFPYESGKGWRLPFYVRYHRGPMNNLSNFTKRQESIGIGFKLY